MALRWVIVLGLLPVYVLERAAYYGARSQIPLALAEAGTSGPENATLYAKLAWIWLGGIAVGGLAALATGPRVVLAAGVAILAVGSASVAMSVDAPMIGGAVLVFGSGVARPAIIGAAAGALDGERANLRTALMFALLAAADVGGFLGPIVTGFGRGPTPFAVAALLAAVATGGAATLASLGRRLPDRSPPVTSRAHLVLVFVLAVITAVPRAVGAEIPVELLGSALYAEPALIAAQVVGTLIVTVVGAVTLLVLHARGVRVPLLLPVGAGFVIATLGQAAALLSEGDDALGAAGVLTIALGGTIVTAPLLSRLAGDLPRLGTLVVAVYYVATHLATVGWALGRTSGVPLEAAGWATTAGTLVLGLGLAIAAPGLRRVFVATPREDREDVGPTEF